MSGTHVSKAARSGFWAEVEITQGNIDNGHFYLRGFLERFPSDLVGGSNIAKVAPQTAKVDWGLAIVETDIDGQKQFFRKRSWAKQFFAANDAKPGDRIRIEETAPYCYRVLLLKAGKP